MIGLDTGALIDIVRRNPAVKKVIDEIDEPLSSTLVNYQELLFGLDFDKAQHLEEEKSYVELFKAIYLFSLTSASCQKAAHLFHRLQKEGSDIGKFDIIIAGIFLENGVTKLITKNKKHFEKIKGIEVISY